MIHPKVKHTSVLFFDVETVPIVKKLFECPAPLAIAWQSICDSRYKEEMLRDPKLNSGLLFLRDAALYPEFAKIVCISVGVFHTKDGDDSCFRVKAICGDDETKILQDFSNMVTQASGTYKIACAHNLKNFDLPFIIRRATVCGVPLPSNFNIVGVKPWDLDATFIDTRDLWSGTAYNLGSCSLESICAVLGIESPKEEMNGAMVSTIYYNHNDPDRLKKIGKYCNADTVATSRIFQRLSDPSPIFNLVSNEY